MAVTVRRADQHQDPGSIKTRAITYPTIPRAALIGPTGQSMRVATQGGVSVCASITRLGWSRLFRTPADHFLR